MPSSGILRVVLASIDGEVEMDNICRRPSSRPIWCHAFP